MNQDKRVLLLNGQHMFNILQLFTIISRPSVYIAYTVMFTFDFQEMVRPNSSFFILSIPT